MPTTPAAQLDLFDDLNPPHEPLGDCDVFNQPNIHQGHLRIDIAGSTYVFLDTSQDAIYFGHMAGPTGRLTIEQLRSIGDYCHRAADRIARRIEATEDSA